MLDILLPRLDGMSVCRSLCAQCSMVPILMLTARDAVEDRVAGLDAGAGDYLTKPFAFKELLARLRALLRRSRQIRAPQLKLADLTLDISSQRAWRGGSEIRLTAKEFAFLEYLMIHAGEVLSWQSISEHVWDENFDPFSNLIEVYIRRLRKKIDCGRMQKLIYTRRGLGYMLSAEVIEEPDSWNQDWD